VNCYFESIDAKITGRKSQELLRRAQDLCRTRFVAATQIIDEGVGVGRGFRQTNFAAVCSHECQSDYSLDLITRWMKLQYLTHLTQPSY